LRATLAPERLGPVGRGSRLVLGSVAIWAGLSAGAAALLGQQVALWPGVPGLDAGSLVLSLFSLYVGGNMILAAIKGWSGCEITATPRAVFGWNLVLVCPLFTPLDLLDSAGRRIARFVTAPPNR